MSTRVELHGSASGIKQVTLFYDPKGLYMAGDLDPELEVRMAYLDVHSLTNKQQAVMIAGLPSLAKHHHPQQLVKLERNIK